MKWGYYDKNIAVTKSHKVSKISIKIYEFQKRISLLGSRKLP